MEPIIPNDKDIKMAKQSSIILADLLSKKTHELELEFNDAVKGRQKIAISEAASLMLLNILQQISRGNAITITSIHTELTTQEAADILKVSRPFLVKELEKGKISYKMVGTRRKILYTDLMEYKKSMHRGRLDALDKLTQESQDLDLDY